MCWYLLSEVSAADAASFRNDCSSGLAESDARQYEVPSATQVSVSVPPSPRSAFGSGDVSIAAVCETFTLHNGVKDVDG